MKTITCAYRNCENEVILPCIKYCSKSCVGKEWRKKNPDYIKEWKVRIYQKAFKRLAIIWNLVLFQCHHCGIISYLAIQFGHPLNNGKEHRKFITSGKKYHSLYMAQWIINITNKEIKKWCIKPECAQCNMFYQKTNRYPTYKEIKSMAKSRLKFLKKKREVR